MWVNQSMGAADQSVNPGQNVYRRGRRRYPAEVTASREPRRPSNTPRYIAIAAQVRDRIIVEQLGPHTLLPSERELAEQHQVSR
ncbi:MAG: yvoA 2, partial [Mycobacterium sp.]|nr:yvoA 2 [Mycobacterium sp.]